MRRLLLFLAIVFSFQSCFTYRISDLSPDKMNSGEKYKILRNNKYEKVKIKQITDNYAIIELKYGKQKNIPLAEITKVRKRKFSIIKTVALPTTVAVGIAGLFALTYKGPN